MQDKHRKLNFHVMTLFPDMMQGIMSESITGRAMSKGVISLNTYNIRDYAQKKNHHVDDYIYGGGSGMLMQAEPVWLCYKDVMRHIPHGRGRVLYMSPQGKTLNQSIARALSQNDDIVFLCGHYEGIDERAIELINPVHISIGDYVLTGGELAAAVIMDAVTRLLPGALGSDDSAVYESFYDGLLEYPQYTRPETYEGLRVPEVLLSGNHARINEWRRAQAIERTRDRRPDMYEKYIQSRH